MSSFNPFGAGQGLSTNFNQTSPDRAGAFQSLWNRARSLDLTLTQRIQILGCFNPFGAGRVFRQLIQVRNQLQEQFQSLWNRAGSFDDNANTRVAKSGEFQSLWNRAGSFDKYTITDAFGVNVFQSLWNRARSFDAESPIDLDILAVSIPLEQGGVFRLIYGKTKFFSCLFQSLWSRAGSFDKSRLAKMKKEECFNPFGTGRGLSTLTALRKLEFCWVSIPL